MNMFSTHLRTAQAQVNPLQPKARADLLSAFCNQRMFHLEVCLKLGGLFWMGLKRKLKGHHLHINIWRGPQLRETLPLLSYALLVSQPGLPTGPCHPLQSFRDLCAPLSPLNTLPKGIERKASWVSSQEELQNQSSKLPLVSVILCATAKTSQPALPSNRAQPPRSCRNAARALSVAAPGQCGCTSFRGPPKMVALMSWLFPSKTNRKGVP